MNRFTKIASRFASAVMPKATAEEKPVEVKAEEKVEAPKAEEAKPAEKEEVKSAKADDNDCVSCPHCSKAFTVEYDPTKPEAKAEEPKEEVKAEEAPTEDKKEDKVEEKKDEEPKAQDVVPTAKAQMPSLSEWKAAFALDVKPSAQTENFRSACNEVFKI